MNAPDAPRAQYPALIEEQLRLLEERRADVATLLQPGVARNEAVVDRMANDLVGVRLVVRAALSAPPPVGATGAARDELELREREASVLLGAVLAVLRPWRGVSGFAEGRPRQRAGAEEARRASSGNETPTTLRRRPSVGSSSSPL